MPWQVLAFATGIWALQQVAVLPAPTFLGVAGAAGLLLWFPGRLSRGSGVRWLGAGGALLLGFAWAGGHAQLRLADALPADWEGRDIEVTGVVAELPRPFERGVRFVFAVEESAAPLPARLLLSWYRSADAPLSLPRSGERWRLTVRLKRPHGNVNPHGFDYEGWLFERDIRATGYVRQLPVPQRQMEQAAGFALAIERLRETTRARMLTALSEQPYAGVLVALAIGDQQSIAPELWRMFAATGITHLMSISGLHVTMFAALAGGLAFALWRRQPRLPLVWPAQKAAAVAGFLAAVLYALIAGFGIPAQRTLYMLGMVAFALVSGRAVSTPRVLGAALLLVLLIDPWAVLSAGFWLSFGAVGLLFYVANGRLARAHWLLEWGRAQWAITLGLMPALLALFQQFSLVSPLANAVAIPLVSLAITPLALLGSVPGFGLALDVAHWLLVPLMDFLGWLATLPGALWQQHAPPGWTVVLALAGGAWLLLPRGMPVRWLGAAAFMPLLLVAPERPLPGEFHLVTLDVGQGQALHVQTATRDLLFDTGPDFDGAADAGNRILMPYLRAVGVRRFDRLIVSHDDIDHDGGTASLLASVPVERVERRCVAGEAWEWDGVRFLVLHPAAADYARALPDNALSCVLKIESVHGAALIAGDIEGRAEAELLARHGAALHADVLIAPHHGAKKTASADFVAAVAAREVIFSVGYRNRFGHPHPAVLERFSGSRIHRTDRDGAVTVKVGPGGTAVNHEREARRRYWHNDALSQQETLP